VRRNLEHFLSTAAERHQKSGDSRTVPFSA
jgi:hypothetical protein